MGKDISYSYKEAMDVYDEANSILGYDLKKICFKGPDKELFKARIGQAALITTSIAIFKVIQKYGIKPNICAGLSIGEYSALIAAKAINFEDALILLEKRLKYMTDAVKNFKVAMGVVIGLQKETILKAINLSIDEGIVEIANYNCPGQIVITGEHSAVKKACRICTEKGAIRVSLLPVKLPFHSSLLAKAGDKLMKDFEKIKCAEPEVPVLSNYKATKYTKKVLPSTLAKQMYSSVLWEDIVYLMINEGVNTFIEIGPGDTVTKFVNRINESIKAEIDALNVENIPTLKTVIKLLKKNEFM
jgi:[acyl-carrier-protein] S-malonyltransferase